MKKFILIIGMILLMLLESALADDAVQASGYIFLEVKEPPKIDYKLAAMQSHLTGFSIKPIINKYIPIDKNGALTTLVTFFLLILILPTTKIIRYCCGWQDSRQQTIYYNYFVGRL